MIARLLGRFDSRADTPGDAVELTTDVGPLLFPAEDQVMRPSIAQTGDWELDEAILFRAHLRRGMTVIDVGAHVGYYTVLAARAVGWRGHVVAVEPHPANAALLRANVARNRLARRVHVVEAAAWREPVTLTLEPGAEQNTADNRIVRSAARADVIEVDGIALDALVDELDVGLVKVDAQGTDHVAIAGLEETLRRARPVLFVEYWPHGIRAFGDDPAAVIDLYRSLGFRLTIPGVQAPVYAWSGPDFVEAAERMPGGLFTLALRPH